MVTILTGQNPETTVKTEQPLIASLKAMPLKNTEPASTAVTFTKSDGVTISSLKNNHKINTVQSDAIRLISNTSIVATPVKSSTILSSQNNDVIINGKKVENTTIKELGEEYQKGVNYKLAVLTTEKNGVDEIFFEHENKKYVLFSKDLELPGLKSNTSKNILKVNGKEVKVLDINNELNSKFEQVKVVAKAAISDGAGGAAGGLLVSLLSLSKVKPLAALSVGFISGFAWGAGSAIVGGQHKKHDVDLATIQEIIK